MLTCTAALLLGLLTMGQGSPTRELDIKDEELRMPDVQPQKKDTYLCVAKKMEKTASYIVGFVPHANMSTAHHMLLFGCKQPGHTDKVWDCGEMSGKNSKSSGYSMGPICGDERESIIYAWAMDAPQLSLPKDVGFKVGGESDIQWLVLQVHYKDVSKFVPPQSGFDHSGITMKVTKTEQPHRAGVYEIGTGGRIDPHTTVYMEAACKITENIVMHPFAFRVHTHIHGQVNSGYRVREGEWSEIGRQTPKKPQMFYNTTTAGLTVRKGDYLAARCTMTNDEDRTVYIGATQNDEMCNFYIMYYVNGDKLIHNADCGSEGPPRWYWSTLGNDFNYLAAPKSASIVPGSDKHLVETMSRYDETEIEDSESRRLDAVDVRLLLEKMLGRNDGYNEEEDFEDEEDEMDFEDEDDEVDFEDEDDDVDFEDEEEKEEDFEEDQRDFEEYKKHFEDDTKHNLVRTLLKLYEKVDD